ncbi:MAG: glycosyltransferase [Actinobacteria bacterium]|nr:glycosyltransferase [Actinomycetota bacterium]
MKKSLSSKPGSLPLVSIVTPTFEHGEFLELAIRSVLAQDYPNIEYIVIDNASTDGTRELLERYDACISHWESQSDEGPTYALRKGFDMARGSILGWLNSDDLLLPGAVSAAVSSLMNDEQIDVVYGHRLRIDSQSRVIGFDIAPSTISGLVLRTGSWIPSETAYFRTSIYEAANGISLAPTLGFDYKLWVEMFKAGARFCNTGHFGGAFRVHAGSFSARYPAETWNEFLSMRDRYFGMRFSDRLLNRVCDWGLRRAWWRLRKGIYSTTQSKMLAAAKASLGHIVAA